MKHGDTEIGLIEWVWDHYGRGKLTLAIDEILQKEYNEREVKCLMIVELWCAHPDNNLGPTIRQAIQVLCFEAALPDLPSKKPVPMYHVPTPNIVSQGASLTTTLQAGPVLLETTKFVSLENYSAADFFVYETEILHTSSPHELRTKKWGTCSIKIWICS
ncbi:hypothetical protein K1719_017664 [Acacia pycnantha]|nr:hypothetical protein K1719_017664 [Acacia pycnantha]